MLETTPLWFNGYNRLSHQLISCKNQFFFGDDDNSEWLFSYRDNLEISEQPSIRLIFSDKCFKKSILKKYFKIVERKHSILLICIKGSSWGHAHYMLGSILYYVDDKLCIGFTKNSRYTFDRKIRHQERLFSCNSPVTCEKIKFPFLAFFKPIPSDLLILKNIKMENNTISLFGDNWTRKIDFTEKKLKIMDSSDHNINLHSTLSSKNHSKYLKYRYLN